MTVELEEHCPCVNIECPRRGRCVECHEHHRTMERPSTCEREGVDVSDAHHARVNARLEAAGWER